MRKGYLDYLRIIASMTIVMIHTASGHWGDLPINGYEWNIINLFDAISRWGVPIFVMISGALFLSKDIDTKTLYTKYVKKLVIVFFGWSFFYGIITFLSTRELRSFAATFISGYFHQWYLLAAIGLYIATPIMRRIVKDKKTCEYFILLSFIFSTLIPTILNVLRLFDINIFNGFFDNLRLCSISGLFGYYALGYYLDTYKAKHTKAIYVLGIFSFIFTILGTTIISNILGTANEAFYGPNTINVFFVSIALFIFFKEKYAKAETTAFYKKWSKYTLCIYLVHPFVQLVLSRIFKINILMFNPLLAIPMHFTITYISSFAIAAIASKIPIVNKYLV